MLYEKLSRLRRPELGHGRLVLDRVRQAPQDGRHAARHYVVFAQLQDGISLLCITTDTEPTMREESVDLWLWGHREVEVGVDSAYCCRGLCP